RRSGDGLSGDGAEDAVSVAVKETQGRVKRKGVKKLPPCPLRGGMLGDVDVADAAAAVIQDNEAVEELGRGRRGWGRSGFRPRPRGGWKETATRPGGGG